MAERRMFAKSIVTSDAFLDLPATARCLYFALGMEADDDGFVGSPKSIMRQVGSSLDDMNILLARGFILVFESGVVCITHWRVHNYIRNDRYKKTRFSIEKQNLKLGSANEYLLSIENPTPAPLGIPKVDKMDTQDRLGKVRLSKKEKEKKEKSIAEIIADGPEGLERELQDFVDMRKEIKAPMSPRAMVLLINRLNELSNGDIVKAKAILEQSIINSWKSVYPLKSASRTGNPFLDLLPEEQRRET